MEIKIKTSKREEIIDITDKISNAINEFNNQSKACLIYTPHTTCGIIIQENYDPDVQTDIINFLNQLVPNKNFLHSEGNSDAHIKSMLTGVSKTIPIENKKLKLGQWQGIGFAEFDGPRERTIIIQELN